MGYATITGQLKDSDGTAWANATWTAVPVSPSSKPVFPDGSPVPTTGGLLDASGHFSGQIPQTIDIRPPGTTLTLTITSMTSAPPLTLTKVQIVSSTTVDLGALLSPRIVAPRIKASAIVYAYAPIEVTNPVHGNGYVNTVENQSYIFMQNSWVPIGVAGPLPANVVQLAPHVNQGDLNINDALLLGAVGPGQFLIASHHNGPLPIAGIRCTQGGDTLFSTSDGGGIYFNWDNPNNRGIFFGDGRGATIFTIDKEGNLTSNNLAAGLGGPLAKFYQPGQSSGTSFISVGLDDLDRATFGFVNTTPTNPQVQIGVSGAPIPLSYDKTGLFTTYAAVVNHDLHVGGTVFGDSGTLNLKGLQIVGGATAALTSQGIRSGAAGDLVMSALTTAGLYLNWDGGTGGIHFGNGNATEIGHIDATGNAFFSGTVSAASKTFNIPHPQDATRRLIHACLEGPENGVYYRGAAELVDGRATVELPDYFEALTFPDERSVLLTQVDDGGELALLAASPVVDGKFSIRASVAAALVSWEVKAVRRAGVDRLGVETDKAKDEPAAPAKVN